LALIQRAGCRATGIDREAAAIAYARAQASSRGLSNCATSVLVDCNEPLPFADGSFDALLCIDAILHPGYLETPAREAGRTGSGRRRGRGHEHALRASSAHPRQRLVAAGPCPAQEPRPGLPGLRAQRNHRGDEGLRAHMPQPSSVPISSPLQTLAEARRRSSQPGREPQQMSQRKRTPSPVQSAPLPIRD
jgi:hypothetical protein